MRVIKWVIERTLNLQAINEKDCEVSEKLKANEKEAERIRKKLNGAVKGAEPMLAEK